MPTIEEIRPIKKDAERDLLKRPGIVGVDIGYKVTKGRKTEDLSIIVYVEEKKDVPTKERIPKEIGGVKTDIVQRRFKPNAFMPVEQLRPAIDATRYAELRGGMSIGPCRSVFLEPPDVPTPGNYIIVGTLGAIVTDNGTGDHMLLTNFHVAAVNDSWSAGDTMAQPARPDGGSCPADSVGTLARAVVQGTTAGGNPGVDGAVISVSGARPTNCEIIGIGDVRGTAVAAVDMAVRKRGRTTELTYGKVISTDLTVSVNFGDGIGNVTFQDQIEIEVDETQSATFGISGDSGSVVVNDGERVVGLYFAGNVEETDAVGNVITPEGVIGIANPIAAVESALNVTVCGTAFKKIEIKEFKEFKEFEKLRIKELFKDFKEFKEFGPKEFKEHKEPKEIYEDKFFEDKYFENPFETPWGRDPGGGPLRSGVVPGAGMGAGPGAGPGVEQRLARLEAALGVAPQAAAQPMAGFGCIDFSAMAPQSLPNPWTHQGISFMALDHAGNPWPNPGIKNFGTVTGLDTGFRMEIKLPPPPCPAIKITLAHFSQPARGEVYDVGNNMIGSQTMSGPQGVPETITLPSGPVIGGGGVAMIVVVAPQDETLILELCCVDAPSKPKPEKPEKPEKFEKREKPEKIEKFEKPEKPEKLEKIEKREKPEKPEKLEKPEKFEKPEKREKPEKPEKFEKPEKREFKEFKDGPKEWKEPKELKDDKEFEPKRFKDDKEFEPKRLKDDKEFEPKRLKDDKEFEPKRLKDDKEFEPKRIKEDFEPKRIKEDLEPKRFKEDLEPKRIKEDKELEPKIVKENKEPKEIYEDKAYEKQFDKSLEKPGERMPGGYPMGGVEQRLAQLEATLGQLSHFIDPSLRPDLSKGALRQEPDAGAYGQKTAKEANDAKQAKDAKDSEKPGEG